MYRTWRLTIKEIKNGEVITDTTKSYGCNMSRCYVERNNYLRWRKRTGEFEHHTIIRYNRWGHYSFINYSTPEHSVTLVVTEEFVEKLR